MSSLIDKNVLSKSLDVAFNEFQHVLNETPTLTVDADQVSGGYISTLPSDFAVTSEIKTIDDIVEEKIEQYKELMRLQALGCKNCGGSINKDTMTCEYCGTSYVLAIKSKPEIDPRWDSF